MPSVLISGASRGIGRATALRLARAGWTVYATVRQAADGEELVAEAAGHEVRPLRLDITLDEQIAALAEALPERLDALVNNAGIVVSGPLETLSAAELREQFEVNVVGSVALTNLVLPRLRPAPGRIVFVSSLSGLVSTPMTGAYNASKFAIEAIADAWRLELRPWGVKVILVEPAMTDTDLWQKAPETLETAAARLSDEHRELYGEHLEGMRRVIPRIQTDRGRRGDDRARPDRDPAAGALPGERRRQGPGRAQDDRAGPDAGRAQREDHRHAGPEALRKTPWSGEARTRGRRGGPAARRGSRRRSGRPAGRAENLSDSPVFGPST